MMLSPGTTLGHYDVTSLLGEGGMGQVWQATDTQLNRQVALKILPDAFAAAADRLARFEREAHILASLNHPNIGGIYGIEEAEGTRALVLELVEGPTLADRIAEGAIPVDEALPIAKQIAEALEAAHEAGIIHRDLKPANIKVREDGTVKVLDFGLAKALDTTPTGDPSQSPTLTAAATQMGVIMGTAAYMSPEQARGKPVDKRADIWACGVVLLEMLTGRKVFEGEDVSMTLSSVLQREPDWSHLPSAVSPSLSVFLHRCLEKDPKQRVADMQDVRLALEGAFEVEASAGRAGTSSQRTRERLLWPFAVLVSTVVSMTLLLWSHRGAPVGDVVRLSLLAEHPTSASTGFALSPDGRHIVYSAPDAEGARRLWIRPLDAVARARPLAGTEGAEYPFWSPDGEVIGFFTPRLVKRVAASGGAVLTLCAGPARARGGSWNQDGTILFAGWSGPLRRVSADGGPSLIVRDVDVSRGEEDLHWPWFLPDGQHYLYRLRTATGEGNGVYVASLDDPMGRLVIETEPPSRAEYAEPGYLVYQGADELLMAQPFDLGRLTVAGAAVPISVEGISSPVGWRAFSTTPGGVLAYSRREETGDSKSRLLWVDRQGALVGSVGGPENYWTVRVSPDDSLVATNPGPDIWIYSAHEGVANRFTSASGTDAVPVWSPDGRHLAFFSNRRGPQELYVKPVDETGDAEPLLAAGREVIPTDWSSDGQVLALTRIGAESLDVWAYSINDDVVSPVVDSEFNESAGVFSPDGRWLAYVSDEAGTEDVYLQPFPGPGPAQRVSQSGGVHPRWRRDGQELYFVTPAKRFMATEIVAGDEGLDVGTPVSLFQMDIRLQPDSAPYDVTAGGDRFLIVARGGVEALTIVRNWSEELKARVP